MTNNERLTTNGGLHCNSQSPWMHTHVELLSAFDWLAIDVKRQRSVGLDRGAADLANRAAANAVHGAVEQPRQLTDRRQARSLLHHHEIQHAIVHFGAGGD